MHKNLKILIFEPLNTIDNLPVSIGRLSWQLQRHFVSKIFFFNFLSFMKILLYNTINVHDLCIVNEQATRHL